MRHRVCKKTLGSITSFVDYVAINNHTMKHTTYAYHDCLCRCCLKPTHRFLFKLKGNRQ